MIEDCVLCGGPTDHDIGSIPMHRECAEQAQDPVRFAQPLPTLDEAR